MCNIGIIIEKYGKVQINKRKRLEIVKVRNLGETNLKKVTPRKPYTEPLSESELTTVKNKLNLE